MSNRDFGVIVAKFDDSRSAQRALREVKKVMSQQQVAVREGAVIVRDADGDLHISDVKELGLSDIVRGTTDLTVAVGRGGFNLTMRLYGRSCWSCGRWRPFGPAQHLAGGNLHRCDIGHPRPQVEQLLGA